MEYDCSGVAKKLCRPMVFISISGHKSPRAAASRSQSNVAAMPKVTGDLSELAMEMNTFIYLHTSPVIEDTWR